MSNDQQITAHYSGSELLSSIEAGLTAMGKTAATATMEDLAPVDEFHIGGRAATTKLCEQLGVLAESKVVDIGCGIGGTARFISSTFGCQVTGIDLTSEYIDVARTLSAWTGLGEQLRFEAGSALDMPFNDGSFDVAAQLHVGMNIEDKGALFEEVFRVLRPGGRFGVYDVMGESGAEHAYPVPWATNSSMSFVDSQSNYRQALESAGFVIRTETNRRDFAVDFFAVLKQRMAEVGGPPPLGLHLIMGDDAATKITHMIEAVASGALAPVELVCEKPLSQGS
ncbi:MAG: methyltransferase domain-containing protein [Deltaproteobacteria bacterium]|nr:methyltransferase domain-containing protein [Deltaproteobacteria bacterium]MBW2719000.1 methyltransferase domain-containing protein [Deltaproteobacteria bacterium]